MTNPKRRSAALNAQKAPQTPRSGLERAFGALNLERRAPALNAPKAP
jgi:hypothetical protein